MHICSFAHCISIVYITSQHQHSCPLPYLHIAHTMHSLACGINSSSNGHLQLLCLKLSTLSVAHLGCQIRGCWASGGVNWNLSLTSVMWCSFIYCSQFVCTYLNWFNHTWSSISNRLWAPCYTSESLCLICVYLHLSVVSAGIILCFICTCLSIVLAGTIFCAYS